MAGERDTKVPAAPPEGSDFGDRIKAIRAKKKLTLEQVSERSKQNGDGISAMQISRAERNETDLTVEKVYHLSYGLDVPVTVLINAKSEPIVYLELSVFTDLLAAIDEYTGTAAAVAKEATAALSTVVHRIGGLAEEAVKLHKRGHEADLMLTGDSATKRGATGVNFYSSRH